MKNLFFKVRSNKKKKYYPIIVKTTEKRHAAVCKSCIKKEREQSEVKICLYELSKADTALEIKLNFLTSPQQIMSLHFTRKIKLGNHKQY